jgi:glycosyltransferase involved in cell wall biosynthesis
MQNSTPPYDLAFVHHSPGMGGAERHSADLVNYLAGAGLRTVLLQSDFDLRSIGVREVPGALDVVHVDLPFYGCSKEQLREWALLFKRHPARRIMLIKAEYLYVDLSLLKLVRQAAPQVFHFEHTLPPKLPPRFSRLHFGFLPGIGLWWYKEVWRRWRRGHLVDMVFVDSEAARQELVQHTLLRADKVRALTNGVDVKRWVRDEGKARAFRGRYGIPPDHYLFGVTGRIVPLKGGDLAIRAFDQLRRRVGGVTLCIVGEGPFRGELERLARELGVEGQVRFTGFVDDIGEAYSAIDTLLLPSKVESCPLVLLEAMSCGCRVVASPVGGVPEILGDPACGALAPTREPADWADLMQRHLQTPPDQRSVLASRTRQFVAAHHDQDRQFRLIAELMGAAPRQGKAAFDRPSTGPSPCGERPGGLGAPLPAES